MMKKHLANFGLFSFLLLLTHCGKHGGNQLQNGGPAPTPTPTTTPQTQPLKLPDHVSLTGHATLLVGECQPYTLTALNGNDKAVTLADVNFSFNPMPQGNYYSDTSCTQNISNLLLAKDKDTAIVYFKPSSAGNMILSLQSTLLGNATYGIVVSGTANFAISPSSNFDYGTTRVGVTRNQEFVVSNAGNGPLSGLSHPTGLAGEFGFLGGSFPGTGGNCVDTLAAGQSCKIEIGFTPSAVTTFTASVTFSYVDGVGTHTATLSLQGNGSIPGNIDASFGSGGTQTTNINGMTDEIRNLTTLSNDSVLAVGNSLSGSGYRFALARYLTNGNLDPSYGTSGVAVYSLGTGASSYAFSSAQQADGKTVVVGYQYKSSLYDSAIARFNVDGSIDTSFATGGQAVLTLSAGYDILTAVAVQSDGKIVAGGYRQNTNFDFSLVRFTSNGSLDTTFGTGGVVSSAIGTSSDMLNSLLIQNDQKILTAGTSVNKSGNYDFSLARYLTNGSLDTGFGTAGKTFTDFFGLADSANAIKMQTDGKIFVAGNAGQSSQNIFGVARYLSNGLIDTTFGSSGKVSSTLSNNEDIKTLSLQTDGKWVVGGTSFYNPKYSFGISRLNSDGTFDTAFGTQGHVAYNVTTGTDKIYALSLLSDGRIVAAGSSYNGTSTQFAIARFYP